MSRPRLLDMFECDFCAIAKGQAPAELVAAWPDVIAFAPLDPVIDGHLLVVPRRHVRDLADDPAITGQVMRAAAQLARPPCNLITSAGVEATQSVMHLHVHVVPRTAGDGLALPWSPR